MEPTEYLAHDAIGLAHLVRDGAAHPTELVDAAIDRIREHDGRLNAVVHERFERAREEAAADLPDGPLRGVPFLLKNLGTEMAGEVIDSGSRSLEGHVPRRDAELVARYRAAGLVVLGRTNASEFGLQPTTEPELHGPTRNPWDTTLSPGGSSGGSGAAVAAGYAPAAQGGDGGGSIRIPASACGLFGLMPSRGRMPLGPDRAESWMGLTREHVLTRSVRDSAAFLDATHGPDPGAPYVAPPPLRPFADEVGADPGRVRIAVSTRPLLGDEIDGHAVDAVRDAADLLSDLGHDVVEAEPGLDRDALVGAFVTVVTASLAAQLDEAAARTGRDVGAGDVEEATWIAALIGRKAPAADLVTALETTRSAARTMAAFHDHHDLFVTSTTVGAPLPLGALDLGRAEEAAMGVVRRMPLRPVLRMVVDQLAGTFLDPIPNTPLFNMTGQPAASVPLHWTAGGLPVGVQVAARYGDEAAILRVAAQLEAARPWFDRRPPTP
ncbi:MAG: amidase family protein [Acidimicrobiia bacterium]|nr:amidase family protein [Acidimicrobiia bacterium]